MATRPSLLGCFWLAVVAVTTAQDSPGSDPQQPTFRTTIQSVRVDLYATRDGNPVTDLRQDEIRLFEDGVPQVIQTFERVSFDMSGSAVEPKTSYESRRLATDPRSRLFVVFFSSRNAGFVSGPLMQERLPLMRQLNDLMGPRDLVAVMTPQMRIADLTFQRRLPANNSEWFAQADDPRHVMWDACFPPTVPGSPNAEMKARHRELVMFDALDALIAHLGGIRDERKHIFVVTSGFRLYTKNRSLGSRMESGGGSPLIPTSPVPLGVAPRLGDSNSSGILPRQCTDDLSALASLDHSDRLEEVAEHARRNNVTLHPVSPSSQGTPGRGRAFGGGREGFNNRTRFESEAALRELAEETDGTAIVNTNNLESSLKKMMTATSAYYLIGYSPTNGAPDGKYREISVKVSRSNTRVRARPGYVALTPAEARPLEPPPPPPPPDPVYSAVSALTTSRLGELHVRPSTWLRRDSSGSPTSALWIVAELDPLIRNRAPWTKGGSASITLRPVGGGTAITRRVEVTPAQAAVQFEFDADTPLAPGLYSAQLEVVAADGEPLGDFVRLTIPREPASLGDSVLSRRTNAPGRQFTRTADPRFRKSEFARIELPTNASEPGVARLFDSKGAVLPVPVQVTERADASGTFRWLVVDLSMAPLAPAYYALEVIQAGTSRITPFRVIP